MQTSLFVLVVVFTPFIDGSHFRYDYVFWESIDGWMKFHPIPAKWNEARLRCQLESSVLASPLNDELHATMKITGNSTISIFTGFAAAYSKGDFVSVEGVPFEPISASWAPGEPDNKDDHEQCISMFSNGSLADVSCDQPRPYICYRKNSEDLLEFDLCGPFDEYVYVLRTGRCYKLHLYGQTWARASMACMAEGGYLAIIDSEMEAMSLSELAAEHPAEDVMSKQKDNFAIGFHDWSEHGMWMTVHGQTLQKAGYQRWGKGQPDNSNSTSTNGEYCGSMTRSGELNDISCDVPFPFICEKGYTL